MIQSALFELEMNSADGSRRAVGVLGEQFAMRDFTRSGYAVTRANLKQSRRGDLRIVDTDTGEVWYVEVKASRRGKDGYYRFTLYKEVAGRVKADHRHASHLLLVCVTPAGNPVYYLMPTMVVSARSISLCDPYAYAGRYAAYRCAPGRLVVCP